MYFFINYKATTMIYTLSLHDALPIYIYTQFLEHYHRIYERSPGSMKLEHLPGHEVFIDFSGTKIDVVDRDTGEVWKRSEEHTSELQSRPHLVCRLLLEKKNHRI